MRRRLRDRRHLPTRPRPIGRSSGLSQSRRGPRGIVGAVVSRWPPTGPGARGAAPKPRRRVARWPAEERNRGDRDTTTEEAALGGRRRCRFAVSRPVNERPRR